MSIADTERSTGEPANELDRVLARALAACDVLPTKKLWPAVGIARGAGQLETADLLLDAIERRDGESLKLIDERARVAFIRRDFSQTLHLLTERNRRAPTATTSVAIAKLHIETGELARALQISDELNTDNPDLVTVRMLAADLARLTGKQEVARAFYLGLVDDHEEHPSSLLELAELSLDDGDRDAAAAFLGRALTKLGDDFSTTVAVKAAEISARLDDASKAAELRDYAERINRERLNATLATLDRELRSIAFASSSVETAPQRPEPELHVVDVQSEALTAEISDHAVLDILRGQFGHQELRPGQAAVIEHVLQGRDVLAIMPTGAGKSLTFQLPAMLGTRTTVVVSPLIALMKDQVETLPPVVRAQTALINSSLSFDEMRARLDLLAAGRLKLIYAAPERLRNYVFLRALRQAGVDRVVVDEAHCISMWGHDFRPDYLFIPRAVTELGDPPILAITATATPEMARQIGAGLGRTMQTVRTSVFRPNLTYEVHHLPNKEAKLVRVIDICRAEKGAGIVYVSSRSDAESIAALLRDRGVNAVPYHAGLESSLRSTNQDLFMTGRARVVVATVAFGMGVNKADVRFIVHVVAPKSLEAYAQESGRAGRDGAPATCILLASRGDRATLSRMARRDEMDIQALRRVYGQLMRQARGRWVIADAAAIRPPVEDPENEPDPKIALGVLEQAGFIRRHPDMPLTYELRRITPDGHINLDPALADHWRTLEACLPPAWPARGACTVVTAEIAQQSRLQPVEIDRMLQAHPGVSVREGQRCVCLRLNDIGEHATERLQSILDRAHADAETRVNQVMAYAEGHRCRHVMLAAHLGEKLNQCGNVCDVCRGKATSPVRRDASTGGKIVVSANSAFAVLQAVRTLPFPVGRTGLVRLLTGSVESRIRPDRSPSFGALKSMPKGKLEALIEQLIETGWLARDLQSEYRLISLTEKGAGATASDLIAFERPAAGR